MAPNFLALATTLENLGARWLLAKKVNFVPWERVDVVWRSAFWDYLVGRNFTQFAAQPRENMKNG